MIPKNIGNPDRIIRIVVGLGLGYVAFMSSGPAAVILWIAALAALVTGLVGWCGVYLLLGINTCKIDKP